MLVVNLQRSSLGAAILALHLSFIPFAQAGTTEEAAATDPSESPSEYAFACGDRTYAYSSIKVEPDVNDANLLKIRIASQDQTFLAGLTQHSRLSHWGHGVLHVTVARADCKFDADKKELFSCYAGDVALALDYSTFEPDEAGYYRFQSVHESIALNGLRISTSIATAYPPQDALYKDLYIVTFDSTHPRPRSMTLKFGADAGRCLLPYAPI